MPLWGPEGTYPGGGTVKRTPARKSATAVKPPPKSSTIEIVSADGTFKARYVAAAFDLIGRLKPNFGRFHRPLLVLSGPPPPGTGRGPPGRVGFDMHYAGVASMASAVRAAAVVPVELVEVPDAPHELVFEPDVNASVDRIVRYCADVSAAA